MIWLVFAIALMTGFGSPSRAEEAFEVTGQITEKGQSATIADLKQRAVAEYLRDRLGARYESIAEQVTPEFAEGYVLDYAVGKVDGQAGMIKVSGHLDGQALMRWARLNETKTRGGNFIHPMVILSARTADLSLNARQTADAARSNPTAQTLYRMASEAFQKFGVQLAVPRDGQLPLLEPPKGDYEIRQLREYGLRSGFNSALWFDIETCQPCGGARLQTYFYNLPQGRTAIVRRHNLAAKPGALGNPQTAKALFEKPMEQLAKDFEELASSGALSSRLHQLVVEGLTSYWGFRELVGKIEGLDFVTQAVLKEVQPLKARFEVLSPLATEQLYQRLQAANFGSFRLQPMRVTSNTVIVRYLGQYE